MIEIDGICDDKNLCVIFSFTIRYEADSGIANFADRHRAMAIFSNDLDSFLSIGLWRLWSLKEIVQSGIRMIPENYRIHRNRIGRTLTLKKVDLSLYATF